MMPSNIRHSPEPMPMPCWFDGSDNLDGPFVDPTTAPHDCMMPGCPGPENKRRLEAFEELLARCKECATLLEDWAVILGKEYPSLNIGTLIGSAKRTRAAIAKATGHRPAMLEADAARMDPTAWVAADAERLAQAETAQEAARNKRMIEVFPDLLEVLKDLTALYMASPGCDPHFIAKGRAAIARASPQAR